MVLYAVTIFIGAFLLFQVQPLMGKWILPWFGGGAAVWTTCLLFFQLALLAGYLYAHLLSSRLPRRGQARLHIGLLTLSLAALVLAPDPAIWKPTAADAPIPRIMLLLLVTIGLPYFMLSATSPLLQRWFNSTFPGASPYRLYALSNIGSLLALLSYPVLVEPALPLGRQVLIWDAAYVGFLVLCAVCAWRAAAVPEPPPPPRPEPRPPPDSAPPRHPIWLWLALSATGSAMLLASTNQLCQEVASFPFLWVVPLSLYLLTFIICFDNPRWYDRRVFGALLLISVPLASHLMVEIKVSPIAWQIPVFLLAMFSTCMCCHGELVRLKPVPRHLTLFYLVVSTGGALGGLFVALIAPTFFLGYWEYPISLCAACALTLVAWYRDGAWRTALPRRPGLIWIPLGLFQLLLVVVLLSQTIYGATEPIAIRRDFYGVNLVLLRRSGSDTYRVLRHGSIVHGIQNTVPGKALAPTGYYGAGTGAGLALLRHPHRIQPPPRPLDVAVLGLGIGTLSSHGRPGDRFTFYEIDPNVVSIAREYFTYLAGAQADIDIILGDGRIQLERMLAAHPDGGLYDVMIFDAFSSDSIPIHLLTRECVATYTRLLRPDGILVLHISNRHVDLTPVCRALAEAYHYPAILLETEKDFPAGQFASTWVIFTRNQAFLDDPVIQAAQRPWPDRPPVLWTDDFASLWSVMLREDRHKKSPESAAPADALPAQAVTP